MHPEVKSFLKVKGMGVKVTQRAEGTLKDRAGQHWEIQRIHTFL